MAQFAIQLKEGQTVTVSEADTYQFEGPLTTFFSTGSSLQVIDSWSTRVASYRTADIVSIERSDERAAEAAPIPAEATAAPSDGLATDSSTLDSIDLRDLVAA